MNNFVDNIRLQYIFKRIADIYMFKTMRFKSNLIEKKVSKRGYAVSLEE